jgi:hypothetical protein
VKKLSFLFLLTSFLLVSFSAAAFAQVPTRVRMIQASNEGSNIDPSLRDVHHELGSLFNFSSYRSLKDETLNLSLNQPVVVFVHKGRVIEITLMGQRRDMAKLRVRVQRDGVEILDTQVRLISGRTILIGGPQHARGVIIIALSALF